MKHTYRIRTQPRYHGLPPLTKESLASAIQGALVREIIHGQQSDSVVDVQLQRPSHEEALNEILVALQNLGYSWLEATVTEWADNALGGLLLGGACGTTGFSSGDAGLGLMLTLLGALAGTVLGSFIESEKVVYELRWNGTNWQLVQVQPSATPAFRPELA